MYISVTVNLCCKHPHFRYISMIEFNIHMSKPEGIFTAQQCNCFQAQLEQNQQRYPSNLTAQTYPMRCYFPWPSCLNRSIASVSLPSWAYVTISVVHDITLFCTMNEIIAYDKMHNPPLIQLRELTFSHLKTEQFLSSWANFCLSFITTSQ